MHLPFIEFKFFPFVSSKPKTMKTQPNRLPIANNHIQPYKLIVANKIGNVFNITKDIQLKNITQIVDPIPRI